MKRSPYTENKALAHPDRVESVLKKEIPPMVTFEVDPTDEACNQSCSHCCFNTGSMSNFTKIKEEPLYRALQQGYKMGAKAVEFVGGGEPTAHPNINEIVDSTLNMGYEVGFISNGVLLNRIADKIDRFTYLRVSLDAGSKSIYDTVHGVLGTNHFEKVLDNIGNLPINVRKEKVGLAYLVQPANSSYEEMQNFIKIAVDLNVNYVVFRPAQLNYSIDHNIWITAHQNLTNLQTQYPEVTIYGGVQTPSRWQYLSSKRDYGTFCWTKPFNCVIKADGTVPFCFLYRRNNTLALGNIYNQDIEDIWYSNRHLEMWRSFDISNCPTPCKLDGQNKTIQTIVNEEPINFDINNVIHQNFL